MAIAVIGGTGIGPRLARVGGRLVHLPTEHGLFRAREMELGGQRLLLIQRHSAGHKSPPHRINYRAIARGCAQLGVKGVFATAAVGSLRADWPPGTIAVCHSFLDLTARRLTAWDREVRHVGFREPMSSELRKSLLGGLRSRGLRPKESGVYVGLDGPRYETAEEILMLRQLGGDVVGMTASSEAILMKELNVPYACVAIVTNLGTGLGSEDHSHEGVVEVVESVGDDIVEALKQAAASCGHA